MDEKELKQERRSRCLGAAFGALSVLLLVLAVCRVSGVFRSSGKNDALSDSSEAVSMDTTSQETEAVSLQERGGTADLSAENTETESVKAESLSLSPLCLYIYAGEERTLSAALQPEGAENASGFRFLSSAPEIVSVSEDGTVRGLKAGTAVITVSAGGLTERCPVKVLSHIEELIFPSELTMARGEQTVLSWELLPEDATDSREVSFRSSDPEVAEVLWGGKLRALKAGTAVITADCHGVSAECLVTVNVPLVSLGFSTDYLKLRLGDSVKLPVFMDPSDTTEAASVRFSSLNPAAVTVSEDGTVTAVGAGSSRVTVSAGELSAFMDIEVVIPVTGVSISRSELTINRGESFTLSASLEPFDTTEEKYLYWSSDNVKAATVSDGTVTGVGAGSALICASHDDFMSFCRVNVLSPLRGISLNIDSLTLMEGSSGGFSVCYDPEDTTDDRSVSWSSTDETVATVRDGIVTAVSPGSCRIEAVTGNYKASASVEVIAYAEVESISLSPDTLSFENSGDTAELTVSVSPEGAAETAVSFLSSDTSVASVSADGIVKAVGAGDCVITVSCGRVSAECAVHVNAENIVVVLDPGHCDLHPGAYNASCDVREEVINLKVAQYCRDYLLSHYSGVTVYLTREDGNPRDSSSNGADLEARAQFAQDMGAAILVSMHFNASSTGTASGCVCYVSNQDNVKTQSNALGNSILSEISARTGLLNRGCEWNSSTDYFDSYGNPLDYYAINRHCAARGIPGIIVEHCFMDCDVQFIQTDSALETFGIADAVGIANYLGLQAK